MLRLVTPPRADGQDPPARRRGTKPAPLFLTPDETRHARVATRNASRAYGGIDVLALVIGVPVRTIYRALNGRRTFSGALAIRVAKAAGLAVEAVLTGAMTAAGRCATCGRRAGDGRLLAAGGAR